MSTTVVKSADFQTFLSQIKVMTYESPCS